MSDGWEGMGRDRRSLTDHAEEAGDEGARGEAEGRDRDTKIKTEKGVAVRVENELNDVLGVLDVHLRRRWEVRHERLVGTWLESGLTARPSASLTTSSTWVETCSSMSSISSWSDDSRAEFLSLSVRYIAACEWVEGRQRCRSGGRAEWTRIRRQRVAYEVVV